MSHRRPAKLGSISGDSTPVSRAYVVARLHHPLTYPTCSTADTRQGVVHDFPHHGYRGITAQESFVDEEREKYRTIRGGKKVG